MRHSERLLALETKWDTVIPTLATKSDLADVKVELGHVVSEIHKVEASIKTWMVGTMIGLMIGFGGLFMTVSNSIKLNPAASQPTAPIIFQPQIVMPSPAGPAGK